jgi:hypothetical protein
MMMDERHYDEREADEIFAIAAEAQSQSGPGPHSSGGMTLRELQAIGREAGIAPERVVEAARTLELRRGAPPRGKFLGVPISVGRTVELPRAPTDREWEMLVGELRRTFRARGRVESQGSLRAWTNGNLGAYVEPTGAGHRLRLGTIKGDGIVLTVAAAAGTAITGLLASGLALGSTDDVVGVGMIGLMTAVALVASFGYLPRWARQREEQMERIAQSALTLLTDGE